MISIMETVSISCQNLIDSMHYSILVVNRYGKIVLCSKAACNSLGFPSKEDMQSRNFAYIDPFTWKEYKQLFADGIPQCDKRKNLKNDILKIDRWPLWYGNRVIAIISVFQRYTSYKNNLSDVDSYDSLLKELNISTFTFLKYFKINLQRYQSITAPKTVRPHSPLCSLCRIEFQPASGPVLQ